MENLKIKWYKRSQDQFDKIATWYSCNMGAKAAIHFSEDVSKTAKTLSHSPQIGILEERRSTDKMKYYGILVHPKSYYLSLYKNDSLYSSPSCYYDETKLIILL